MESNTKFSVHETEMAVIINQPNTNQMEEPVEDTLNGCINPSGSTGAIVPVGHENVPFEKNKLLWKAVESLEAFTLMPQKPHFRPLESYKEVEREGKAVGLMVIYDTITKKTLNLQRETARGEIESNLSLLKELETHGFNVLKLRNAWNRLLFLKEQLEDMDNLSKEKKRQLSEFDHDICILKEKRIQLQAEIRKLMEEARLADLGVKKSDYDIASDQLAIRNHDDELTRIGMELRNLVACPLY